MWPSRIAPPTPVSEPIEVLNSGLKNRLPAVTDMGANAATEAATERALKNLIMGGRSTYLGHGIVFPRLGRLFVPLPCRLFWSTDTKFFLLSDLAIRSHQLNPSFDNFLGQTGENSVAGVRFDRAHPKKHPQATRLGTFARLCQKPHS